MNFINIRFCYRIEGINTKSQLMMSFHCCCHIWKRITVSLVVLLFKMVKFGGTIEIRLECRRLKKCCLIWNYYVCCLWAPLLVLTQSKETVSWSNLVFFTIKARFCQYYLYLNMKKSHFLMSFYFLVLLGPIISRFFCMFKCGKKIKKNKNNGCLL